MKLLDWYYAKCGDGDLAKFSKKYSIEIDWIIEAGCHDGSDTLDLVKNFPTAQVYAFEPDPKSRAQAELRFNETSEGKIKLFPYGLSYQNSSQFLSYVNNEKGRGTSSISETGTDPVEIISLDRFLSLPSNSGLLWLDVEGHAVNALRGMKETLKGIDLAKVEIQMHQKSDQRPQDFAEVIEIMAEADLIPVKGPIHPGFFGDIYFVKRQSVSIFGIIVSLLLRLQMQLLHRVIYPLLSKPRD